jgi:hypothetical protein
LDYNRVPYRLYRDPEAYQREQQGLFDGSTWKCLRLVGTERSLSISMRQKLYRAPSRHWVGLTDYSHGPIVTLCTCRPSVPDRTSRTRSKINHQLGVRAEASPSERRDGCSMPLSSTEHTGKVSKPYGAILRHEEGHPAQSASLMGLVGWQAIAHHRDSADETRHQSSRRSNRTETARRCRQCVV